VYIDFLLSTFKEYKNNDAIIWNGGKENYCNLIDKINNYKQFIDDHHIQKGAVVSLISDYSPNSIALLLALIDRQCIVVPLTKTNKYNEQNLFNIAQVEFCFRINDKDNIIFERSSYISDNKYYELLRKREHPGLVLFTSGTSGKPKAAIHDILALLEKFKVKRTALRTLNFLLFDHWGGLNTMFHILSNGGVVIATKNRDPENVCELIQKHKIELLPASPTFLNLMLLSGAYENYDMSSLIIISYGTEPMPESTLKRLKVIFPNIKLLQTYGLIELGVMQSKSERDDSLWVKIGGTGYSTRVVNGLLEIKAKSAMLGYLNAPSPFTEDGWFKTGDAVEVSGEYIKILGRKSEIINVGGDKVYPQEVESVIQEMDNINDVTVYAEKNPIMGNIVCAKVVLSAEVNKKIFVKELKQFCKKRIKKYMIPVKVKFTNDRLYGSRFKKNRLDAKCDD